MIAALLILFLMALVLRPFEKWEGSVAKRANTSKVPIELVYVLDMMCIPLMLVVMIGFPSAVLLTPPTKVPEMLGSKDILTDMLFWTASGFLSYLLVNSARILISYAWSFFGFAGFKLYSWGGWKSVPAFILLPFLVLAPITLAMNKLLTSSLAGFLSAFDGSVNYAPIMVIFTIVNVAMVINGVMRAPSQGQFLLQYTMAIAEAVKDGNIAIVRRNAAMGIPTELPLLTDWGDEYEEVDRASAQKLLKSVNSGAAKLRPYLLRNKGTGQYALQDGAGQLVEVDVSADKKTVDLTKV
jgi:phage-related holin